MSAELAPGLLLALERLDERLEAAVEAAQTAWGRELGSDPFRGLYVAPDDVRALLARGPLGPPFALGETGPLAPADEPPFDRFAAAFGLGQFELDVVLLALAPELDARYGRIYGFLQDDVTKRRATVDLALTLLCSSREERLPALQCFRPHAPLATGDIVATDDEATFANRTLALDPQIADILLGSAGLHPICARFATLTWPTRNFAEMPAAEQTREELENLVARSLEERTPLRLALSGRAAAHRAAAEAIAAACGSALVAADVRDLVDEPDPRKALRLLFRERWLRGAVLLLEGLEGLVADNRRRELEALLDELAACGGIVLLSTADRWQPPASGHRPPLGLVALAFGDPGEEVRREVWERALARNGFDVDGDIELLSSRYALTEPQIAEAVAAAANGAVAPREPDLFTAARRQSHQRLGELATRIEPNARWTDLVVQEDTFEQLRELCAWVAHRHRVLDDWGFGCRTSRGRGIAALFSGASGTGKTLAAEVIAAELGLDLYRIDLAGVVSKYIGETEKNLDRIFAVAEDANAVLLFDEADALFGKRSAVRDSHDRYANIEISYLLQKMEAYDGLAILATNLRDNLDPAFVRRLAFVVTFAFPEAEKRREIFDVVWPDALPRADDVDLDALAEEHRLSGGQIRNIVLSAAYLAADDGLVVRSAHLERALKREYAKTGREARSTPAVETAA